MKKRLYKAIEQASEFQTLLVLLVVIALRARRAIPTLRPHHILIPITTLQIGLFAYTLANQYYYVLILGNLIIIALALFPMILQPQKPIAHWVKRQ